MQSHQVSYPKCKTCSLGLLLPAPHHKYRTPEMCQCLSSVSLQRSLCEAKPRLPLPSVAAVQSSPAQVIAILLHASRRRWIQCCGAESEGGCTAEECEDRTTGSHV